MKKILYELKCIEKENERNGLWEKEIVSPWLYKHYIENKKILNNLYNIIKNYYDLINYFESKKKKNISFDIKKNEISDNFDNGNKRWIWKQQRKELEMEINILKLKRERKKLIHYKYKDETKKAIRMGKSINTFKNMTKQVYISYRKDKKFVKKKEKKILINIEKNIIFNNLILEIYKFTNSICNVINDNIFEGSMDINSRQLKTNLINNKSKNKIKSFKTDNEEIKDKNNEFLNVGILELIFKNSIELIGKTENNLCNNNNNLLIKKIDNNLLYIIDNDIKLIKIMMYFNLIDIFISYFLFISKCVNKELIYYISIFIIIIKKFRNKFSLLSKTIIENKNIFTIFFLFSNAIKKNILSNETNVYRFPYFEKKTKWNNTNLFNIKLEKGKKYFLDDIKKFYFNLMYTYDKLNNNNVIIKNKMQSKQIENKKCKNYYYSEEYIDKTCYNENEKNVNLLLNKENDFKEKKKKALKPTNIENTEMFDKKKLILKTSLNI